jgi:DNA-binding GntR family transcriptional regulator
VSNLTAYDQIRRAIVEGRYRPGQRLIEQRIAEEFALSRTPVREALRRLEAEGLVHSEPNRGAVVREISLADIADLYGLRARLEAYAAELAATRIDADGIAVLDAGMASFEEALHGDFADRVERIHALDDANRVIHGAIKAAAGHHRLLQILERTVDIPLVFQAFRQFDDAELERSHLFHTLIRDAIVAGDAARAAALMHEHVLQGRDVLITSLETGATTDLFELAQPAQAGKTPERES